jgi:hypothetical protein
METGTGPLGDVYSMRGGEVRGRGTDEENEQAMETHRRVCPCSNATQTLKNTFCPFSQL